MSFFRVPYGVVFGAQLVAAGVLIILVVCTRFTHLARQAPALLVAGLAGGAVAVLVGAWITRRYAPRRSATETEVAAFRRGRRRS
jgi:hypothetical protein